MAERNHIRDSFIFELSKVETLAIRERMVETIMFVDLPLAKEIAEALKLELPAKPTELPNPADPDNNIVPENRSLNAASEEAGHKKGEKKQALVKDSPSLSMVKPGIGSCETRKVAILVSEASKLSELNKFKSHLEKQGVVVEVLGTGVGELKIVGGSTQSHKSIASTPSVIYDGVYAMTPSSGYKKPDDLGKALKFLGQAYKHCKTIGASEDAEDLIGSGTMGHVKSSKGKAATGVVRFGAKDSANEFVKLLGMHRHWDREDSVKALPF